MKTETSSAKRYLFQIAPRAAAILAAVAGALVLAAWTLGDPPLPSRWPGFFQMKANAAFSFLLAGLSLWLLQSSSDGVPGKPVRRRLAQLLSSGAALMGLLTLGEYLFGWSLGSDEWLVRDVVEATGTSFPGRMSPHSAVSFLLVGVALLLLDKQTRRGRRPAQFLALVVFGISYFGLLGSLYGSTYFYGLSPATRLAVPFSAMWLLLLSAGILLARGEVGIVKNLLSSTAGGASLRRLLPPAIALAPFLGWLWLIEQKADLYNREMGVALFVLATVLILTFLIWTNALRLDRAERVLHASEERFRGLIESAPDPMVVVGPQGSIVFVNSRAESVFGYSREELLNQKVEMLMPERFRNRHPGHRNRFFGDPGVRPMGAGLELYALRKDGTEFPVEISLGPLETEEGLLVSSVISDVTERKKADEALKESEERLKLALDSAQMGAWDLDIVNDTAVRSLRHDEIFGYSTLQPKWGAEIFFTHLLPEDRETVKSRFDEAYRTGNFTMECRIVRTDRAIRWIAAEGRVQRDSQGQPVRMMGVVADITERKKADEDLVFRTAQLEAANKELEAFCYSVSHDLRAPLRSIDGFSHALLEDCAGGLDDQGRSHLQRIRAATQRMGLLIDDLLNLSRVTRSEMRVERLSISSLARSVAAELQETQPDRCLEFRIEDGLEARADPRLLRLVLENLLGNAWKFTGKRESARIEVGKAQVNGSEAYFVRDDGAGFDPRFADRLFGPFQRLHAMDEFPGTGVGLALVQRIIQRHGGRIWADAAVERGATFYFTLAETKS